MSMDTATELDAELAALLQRKEKLTQLVKVMRDVRRLERELGRCNPQIDGIVKVAGDQVVVEFGITWDELLAKCRMEKIAEARSVVCYLCRQFGCGLADTGEKLRINHTTVLYADQRVRQRIEQEPKFAERVKKTLARVRADLIEKKLIDPMP